MDAESRDRQIKFRNAFRNRNGNPRDGKHFPFFCYCFYMNADQATGDIIVMEFHLPVLFSHQIV